MSIISKRLLIPFSLFNVNPKRVVLSIIGHDANIKDMIINDIIVGDNVIVDVKYETIPISQYKLYIIPKSSCKQLSPGDNCLVFNINDCFVKLKSGLVTNFKTNIPVKINPIVPKSFMTETKIMTKDGAMTTFNYYGQIPVDPMNYFCSYTTGTEFLVEEIEKIYPDTFSIADKYSVEEMKTNYINKLQPASIFAGVTNIVIANKFSDCVKNDVCYMIDFNLIPLDNIIHGIILIQPKRNPYFVIYYPTLIVELIPPQLASIKHFIEMDRIQFMNYEYCKAE